MASFDKYLDRHNLYYKQNQLQLLVIMELRKYFAQLCKLIGKLI